MRGEGKGKGTEEKGKNRRNEEGRVVGEAA